MAMIIILNINTALEQKSTNRSQLQVLYRTIRDETSMHSQSENG